MKFIAFLLAFSLLASCSKGGGGSSTSVDNGGTNPPTTNPGGGTPNPPVQNDTTPPSVPIPLFFVSQSGEQNELSFLTGGEASEISSDTAKIKYYRLLSFDDPNPVLVLEASREDFLAKTVRLPLVEGVVNFFKISALDEAGNESQKNSGLTIINQNSISLPMPYLDEEVNQRDNTATLDASVRLRGMLSVNALEIVVYRDAGLTNLVSSSISSVFEDAGIDIPLIPNQVNTFYLVAKRGVDISSPLLFTITHDSIAPEAPVMDPEVILDAQSPYDLSEEAVDLYGTIESDVVKVIVYSSPDLSEVVRELPIQEGLSMFFGTVPLQVGNNDFFLVAVDSAGNRSGPLGISFTRLSYDVED